MEQQTVTRQGTTLHAWVKVLVIAMTTIIVMFVCFGLGVGVGSQVIGNVSAAIDPAAHLTSSDDGNRSGGSAASPGIAPAKTQTPSQGGESGDISLDMALVNEAWRLLQKQFYGDLPQGKETTYDALRGIVRGLGDPYTAFVDPEQAAVLNEHTDGHFEGIGANVELAPGGGVALRYVFPGQPAEKAGLQAGDVIIAVDGKDITQLDLMEAITHIRGPRGTEVLLKIQRGGGEPFEVKVVRDRIEIPVVQTKTLADGRIAYIALSEFSSVAPDRLAETLKEALASKPAGLILDLRGNPGGLLDAAVSIGSYFVPEGNILIERTKDGQERVYKREGRYLLGDTPLAVLVDGGSASASEIVAGAIQDAGTGKLIGEKTFGKGSVQLPNALSDGSQLRVTIAHWFTPKDRGIHGAGLQPDIEVPLTSEDRQAKRDPQLDRAVEYLLTGK